VLQHGLNRVHASVMAYTFACPGGASNRAKRSPLQPSNERFGSTASFLPSAVHFRSTPMNGHIQSPSARLKKSDVGSKPHGTQILRAVGAAIE
jgi:hypothetical protein